MEATIIFFEPKGTILEVVRVAKKRNFKVVALTSNASLIQQAPYPYKTAVECIDEIITIPNWSNWNQIIEVIDKIHEKSPIRGTYSGVEPAAIINATIREKYGLPTISPQSIELIINKFTLRNKLREIGLSKIKNVHGKIVDKWTKWEFSGSAYFKPVRGFFSACVQKCTNFDELQIAKQKWQNFVSNGTSWIHDYLSSINEYHLEEAFNGELMSVEAYTHAGQFYSLGILSRILFSQNPVVEMGSCFPYPHPLADKIIDVVKQAHEKLGITYGATHTEVIVNEAGEIEIIDLNPRFVGADVLQSINFAYDIEIQELLLDIALGNIPKVVNNCNNYSCLQYILPPSCNKLLSLTFPTVPEIKFSTNLIPIGSDIKSTTEQTDVIGCFLTVMPTFKEAINCSQELRKQVLINDSLKGVY
ncbi:MAG: ATP-grasp domain-containing protein [Tolypothrix carrinoi HA7290-LM1]|nr:ATP-grasp domain-containing protein [Tolypothrix carrinoi HA7290-LM1]